MKYDLVISIDPGLKGAVAILLNQTPIIYEIPVRKSPSKSSNKKEYDVLKIVELLRPFTLDKTFRIITSIERVSSRPGESGVASFSFGRGVGILEGIFTALFNKEPTLISPQTWKKKYTDITECKEILDIKEIVKAKKEEIKVLEEELKIKSKDKVQKSSIKVKLKEHKKEIAKLGRQIKYIAKSKAREIATKLYPDLADQFKLVGDDGKAESLLIALYTKEHYELV